MAPLRFKRTTLLLIGLWLGGLAAWLAVGEPQAARLQSGLDHQPLQESSGQQVQADAVIVHAQKASPTRAPQRAPRPVQADEHPPGPRRLGHPNPPTPSDDDVPPCPCGIEPPLPQAASIAPISPATVADRKHEALELFQTLRSEDAKYWNWYSNLEFQPVRIEYHPEGLGARKPYDRARSALKELPTYKHEFEFRGIVTDEMGKPRPGAGVFAYSFVGERREHPASDSDWELGYGEVYRRVSLGCADESGRFTLTHTLELRCPPDVSFDLYAEDSVSTRSAVATRIAGRHHEFVTLVCPETGDIELELLTPEGAPVADVAIELGWDDRDVAAGAKGAYEYSLPRSDEQGMIEATGIAAGRRVLRLLGESYKDVPPIELLVKSGETTTVRTPRVKAQTGFRASFTRDGEEWCNNFVSLVLRDATSEGRADIMLRVLPDDTGRAEVVLESANAGEWEVLEQRGDDLQLVCRRILVVAGRMPEIQFALPSETEPASAED